MGVGALSGVNEFLSVLLEANAKGYKIRDDLLRGMDHNMYRIGIVLIMPRLHGVLVKGIVIVFVTQNADPPLGEEGVASAGYVLGYYHNALLFRQIQGAI